MKKLTNKLSKLRLLGLVLCGLVLSACGYSESTLEDEWWAGYDTACEEFRRNMNPALYSRSKPRDCR
jgi:hypothetical protein